MELGTVGCSREKKHQMRRKLWGLFSCDACVVPNVTNNVDSFCSERDCGAQQASVGVENMDSFCSERTCGAQRTCSRGGSGCDRLEDVAQMPGKTFGN